MTRFSLAALMADHVQGASVTKIPGLILYAFKDRSTLGVSLNEIAMAIADSIGCSLPVYKDKFKGDGSIVSDVLLSGVEIINVRGALFTLFVRDGGTESLVLFTAVGISDSAAFTSLNALRDALRAPSQLYLTDNAFSE